MSDFYSHLSPYRWIRLTMLVCCVVLICRVGAIPAQDSSDQQELTRLESKRDELTVELNRINGRIAKLKVGGFRFPGPLESLTVDASMLTRHFEIVETRFIKPGDFRSPIAGNLVDCDVITITLKTRERIVAPLLPKSPLGSRYPEIKFYREIRGNDELIKSTLLLAQETSGLEAGEVFTAWMYIEPEDGSRKLLERGVTKAKFFVSK